MPPHEVLVLVQLIAYESGSSYNPYIELIELLTRAEWRDEWGPFASSRILNPRGIDHGGTPTVNR